MEGFQTPPAQTPRKGLGVAITQKISDIHADPERERRWSFGVISVIGFAAIILGSVQIISDIRSPFYVAKDTNTNTSAQPSANLEVLRSKDTDQDGLDDYTELYVQGTSPYLGDSDSDKVNDNDEVKAGTDPNCPQGQTCQQRTILDDTSTADETSTDNADTDTVTPEELRKTLVASGAPQATIDQLSDSELVELYNETVTETGTDPLAESTNTNTNAFSDLGTESNLETTDVLNPDASELRSILVELGADEESLNSVDDETLLLIYQEAVNEGLAQ